MKNRNLIYLFLLTLISCKTSRIETDKKVENNKVSLIILGTTQDGGSPHIGCNLKCCKELFNHPEKRRMVVSLGIVDKNYNQRFLFECTPDFPAQINKLNSISDGYNSQMPDGILLTHAHIGHYSGLIYLGKEAKNSAQIKVYAMPRMKHFLENNGPWNQLVNNENILVERLMSDSVFQLNKNIKVRPILVPHRDEYSETVAFIIEGQNKKVLFVPDIDKWERWDQSIISYLTEVDYAFIDGTFYSGEEINNRDLSTIPHPFIIESMNLFSKLSVVEKNKIYFIHFNHTNPALNSSSKEYMEIIKNGFHIAKTDQVIKI
ncbi:MAG: MBL fold metallo-hydrolase [Saprospiraceae bacterium]